MKNWNYQIGFFVKVCTQNWRIRIIKSNIAIQNPKKRADFYFSLVSGKKINKTTDPVKYLMKYINIKYLTRLRVLELFKKSEIIIASINCRQ